MSNQSTRWTLLADPEAVAEQAVARILDAARDAIAKRGVFRLALGGGSTPRRTYQMLAQVQADWSRWQLYYGDERCLPRDDPERNSRLVETAWLERIAPAQRAQLGHFAIPAELGAAAGAERYAEIVARDLPFDLALLGLGEDGHTASLFPGHSHPGDALVYPVYASPKPPSDRISLGPKAFAACRAVLFQVTGAAKRDAVSAWLNGEGIPAASIHGITGVEVLVDREAYPRDQKAKG